MIHAYDKDTSKLPWETEIDANPDGIPAVYEADGREYGAFLHRRLKDKHKDQHQHRDLEGTLFLKRQNPVRKAIMFLPCRKKTQ
jgi:hypothetical protein